MAGKRKKHGSHVWKNLMKNVDLDEPTSFLDHVCLGCTPRECTPNEIVVEQFKKMFESRISSAATEKITRVGKTSREDRCVVLHMEVHAQKCVDRYCELAKQKNWSSYTSSQLLAWTTITSRRKSWSRLENYQKYAHKLS